MEQYTYISPEVVRKLKVNFFQFPFFPKIKSLFLINFPFLIKLSLYIYTSNDFLLSYLLKKQMTTYTTESLQTLLQSKFSMKHLYQIYCWCLIFLSNNPSARDLFLSSWSVQFPFWPTFDINFKYLTWVVYPPRFQWNEQRHIDSCCLYWWLLERFFLHSSHLFHIKEFLYRNMHQLSCQGLMLLRLMYS